MYCTSVPWPNAYVTSVAMHPTRPVAFIATRRPHAYIAEMNLASSPACVIGVPVPTTYSMTQIFVVVTDTGADRVVAVAEDRTVDVYSWQSGGALLFRHVPRGSTLRDAAIRIAMADIRSDVLFMVPLMRMSDRGKGVATEKLPAARLYYARGHPEEVLVDGVTSRLASSKPSSRVYWFSCFAANNQEKTTPHIETDVPVVGLKLHPGGAPILAVLCADAGLRLYDLNSDSAKNGEPVLYNAIDLNTVCGTLQLPSFSKLWVNGDGQCKVFDFVPTPSWSELVAVGAKNKLRKVYLNLHIAVAESRKIVVLDLTMPGSCETLYFATAPSQVEYMGVVCDPVGTHRCSGIASTEERLIAQGSTASTGSRRLLWGLTNQGQMLPLTMDDEFCDATKVLAVAEWVPPIPLFQWAPTLSAPAYSGSKAIDQMSTAEAYCAMYGPTISRQSATNAFTRRDASSTVDRSGNGEVVGEWASQAALLRQRVRTEGKPPRWLLQGKVLRMHVALHPQLPFLVMTTPIEGTFSARRLPTRMSILRRPVTLTAACTLFAPPPCATAIKVLSGRSTHLQAAVCAAAPYCFLADARAGLSVLRVTAADTSLVANVMPDGATSLPGQPSNVGPRGVATASTLLCAIHESGQVTVSNIETVPLPHLGPLNPSTTSDVRFPAARYVLVAVTYVVSSSLRTLTDAPVPRVQTLLIVVDQSLVVSSPAMSMDSLLQSKQRLSAASNAVKLLKVINDSSCGTSSTRETTKPHLMLCDERRGRFASVARDATARWLDLDFGLLTLRHIDGSAVLSDGLKELQCASPQLDAVNRHGCSNVHFFEDAVGVVEWLTSPAGGAAVNTVSGAAAPPTTIPPLCVGYNATTGTFVVPSRQANKRSTVTTAPDSNRAASLFAAPVAVLAATHRSEDDVILVVLVTLDRRLYGYIFGAEDSNGQRPWHLATSGTVSALQTPTRVTFCGAVAICDMPDNTVSWFTFGSAELQLKPLITLSFGCMVTAVSADRIVATVVVPRHIVKEPDHSLAISASELLVGHCSVPLLSAILTAEVDLATNRLNHLNAKRNTVDPTAQAADPTVLAVNLASSVAAWVQHLSGQASLISLGPLLALARLGFHCLVADILKAQATIIADGCLALQPSTLRSIATQQIPRRDDLTAIQLQAPTEAIDTWPVPTADAFLLHAERARQFTAIKHHQDTAGALVVTDGPATLVKKGAHAPVVSSVTLGMPAAHAALHQVSWLSSNERGQYAFDLLVVIASHVPFSALPPDTAKTLEVVIFSKDAATYRAYRVVCHSFGAGTPATALFVDNIKAARNGRRPPRIVTAHHLRDEETTLLAKKLAAVDSVVTLAFNARDTFMNAIRAKGADIRLGNGDHGKLSTVVFPLHRSLVMAFGSEAESNVPGSYMQLRTLLMQSSLMLWPLVSTYAATEEEDQNEQTMTQLALAGGDGVGNNAAADGATERGGQDARSSMGSGRASSQAVSRPAASIVGVAPNTRATLPRPPMSEVTSASASSAAALEFQQHQHGDGALEHPSEASLAEAQQRALRQQFLAGPGGRDADDSDVSSDDGKPKFEIKFRGGAPASAPTPQASPPILGETGTLGLSSTSTMLSSTVNAVNSTGNRRRIGGGGPRSSQAAVPAARDVDDVLASAFAAVEALKFLEAKAEFAAAASILLPMARSGGFAEQAKLRLVAQYRVLCDLQIFLESDAAASLPPSFALAAAVHCAHLRVANEHLAACLKETLQQTVLLQWPSTSASLLSIVRSFAPELLESPEGQELEEKVATLPHLASGQSHPDDAFVASCLQSWRMCAGTFRIYTTGAEASELVACSFCDTKFGPAYLQQRAMGSSTIMCSACGLGELPVPLGAVQTPPSVTLVTPPARLVPLTPPSQPTPVAAQPAVVEPVAVGRPVAQPESQVTMSPTIAPPPPPPVVVVPAANDLDFLFGGGVAPSTAAVPTASPPRRFGAPPPPSAAPVPAAYVDPFADFPPVAPARNNAAPPAPASAAPSDMDAFFS